MANKINYVIGRKWPGTDAIAVHAEWSSTVFRNTEENAFKHAQRVSEDTGYDFCVFVLHNIGRYFDPDLC